LTTPLTDNVLLSSSSSFSSNETSPSGNFRVALGCNNRKTIYVNKRRGKKIQKETIFYFLLQPQSISQSHKPKFPSESPENK
jgi:hypothetical protein